MPHDKEEIITIPTMDDLNSLREELKKELSKSEKSLRAKIKELQLEIHTLKGRGD